jgi:cytochrome o ubiquinol oxidase operon protein cyoD
MHNATLKSYITGFILSVVLTLVAYFLVVNHMLTGTILIAAILGLAMVQLVVQLLFFLHMGQEKNPRWNLMFFVSFLSIIFIVVVASLWIIAHLNYNMSPDQINKRTMQEEGLQKEMKYQK